MFLKRIAAMLAMAFGSLGVAACLAGGYAVWRVGARLEMANEKIFVAIDKGLAATQDRVRGVQKRVKDSRLTSGEITQSLRDWSKRKAEERLLAQLEVERRAETLAGHLQTADHWLEVSTESLRGVQKILELSNLAGSQVDPTSLDEMLETLTSLTQSLQESEKTVEKIREFADAGDSDDNRLARATKLLGRVLVTMSDIDTRLDGPMNRLSELRTEAQDVKARTSQAILWTTIGCYLVLGWIAVGQMALCVCGFRWCWSGRSSG